MKPSLLPLLLLLTNCATSKPWVPLRAEKPADPLITIVWVGRGECERLENGAWVRRPEFDYDFVVEQRRLGDHWESVKNMRRRHPAYDDTSGFGERAQTYFFNLAYSQPDAQGQVKTDVTTTLGNGEGSTDREFRKSELNFSATGISSMAPFDRYRITQTYDYEAGKLTEVVELNKGTQPWVRNHEVAFMYGQRTFPQPPTTR